MKTTKERKHASNEDYAEISERILFRHFLHIRKYTYVVNAERPRVDSICNTLFYLPVMWDSCVQHHR